jgi:hypothetical protein
MLLYQLPDPAQIVLRQSIIPGQFDSGFDPELRLSAFAMHVDMHTRLLKGEEVKPEAAFPEYGGTHGMPSTMPRFREMTRTKNTVNMP